MTIKVLNLYAGIGGNRKLWKDVEVVAVEINEEIAGLYKLYFPNDEVVVGDAHQYLLEHFREFDFIWSSVPCPSHSIARFWAQSVKNPVYPDMKLYEEIIFLKHHFKGQWVIENVISYYKPLICASKIGRHYFWSNFTIPEISVSGFENEKQGEHDFIRRTGFDLSGKDVGQRKDQIYRNIVIPKLGLHVFNCAFRHLH